LPDRVAPMDCFAWLADIDGKVIQNTCAFQEIQLKATEQKYKTKKVLVRSNHMPYDSFITIDQEDIDSLVRKKKNLHSK